MSSDDQEAVDFLLEELPRLMKSPQCQGKPWHLTWRKVQEDDAILEAFMYNTERLSEALGNAKAQRSIFFEAPRLVTGGRHDDLTIKLLNDRPAKRNEFKAAVQRLQSRADERKAAEIAAAAAEQERSPPAPPTEDDRLPPPPPLSDDDELPPPLLPEEEEGAQSTPPPDAELVRESPPPPPFLAFQDEEEEQDVCEVQPVGYRTTLSQSLSSQGRGCAGYGCSKNPQFFLTVKQKTDCSLKMVVTRSKAASAPSQHSVGGICMWVRQTDTAERLADFDSKGRLSNALFRKSSYVSDASVEMPLVDLSPGVYAILVMSQHQVAHEVTVSAELSCGDARSTLAGEVIGAELEVVADTFARVVDQVKTKSSDTVLGKASVYYAYAPEDAKRIVDTVTEQCTIRSTPGRVMTMFLDPVFAHHVSSINNHRGPGEERAGKGETDQVGWQRLHQFAERPQLFGKAGATSSDIAQGFLGNCWFCATVVALASRPEKIAQLFYPQVYNPAGIYSVKLWTGIEWVAVIIDDGLPVSPTEGPDTPFFGRGTDKTKFWFSLLEKAAAKVVGSYQMLLGGSQKSTLPSGAKRPTIGGTLELMSMLSGGVARSLKASSSNKVDTREWFTTLKEYLGKGWICSTGAEESSSPCINGIYTHHAYTPIAVYEKEQEGGGTFASLKKSGGSGQVLQLVQVRNPWGRDGGWTGAYGNKDPIWQKNSALRKACRMEDKTKCDLHGFDEESTIDDGTFWMTKSDFEDYFETLNLCAFPSDEFPVETKLESLQFPAEGNTQGETRCNFGHTSGSYLEHEQILVKGTPGQTVMIRFRYLGKVARHHHHYFSTFPLWEKDYPDAQSRVDCKLPLEAEAAHSSSPPTSGPETVAQMTIPQTASGGRVVLVPLRKAYKGDMPGEERDYEVVVQSRASDSAPTLTNLRPCWSQTVEHAFACDTTYKHKDSPCFLLKLEGKPGESDHGATKSKMLLLKYQAGGNVKLDQAVRIFLTRPEFTDCLPKKSAPPGSIVSESRYLSSDSLAHTVDKPLTIGQSYCLWVVHKEGVKGEQFTLSVVSTAKFSMKILQ